MGGWLAGNFDFNEIPVVHLDLDLALGSCNVLSVKTVKLKVLVAKIGFFFQRHPLTA